MWPRANIAIRGKQRGQNDFPANKGVRTEANKGVRTIFQANKGVSKQRGQNDFPGQTMSQTKTQTGNRCQIPTGQETGVRSRARKNELHARDLTPVLDRTGS
jgi:hypothetical protein